MESSARLKPVQGRVVTTRLGRLHVLLIYAFLYLPLALLILDSFNASKYGIGWQGFTLGWYQSLANDNEILTAAGNSLAVASLAATLATIIGTLGAVGLHRYRFRGRTFLRGLLFVTLMSPDIVIAVSLLVLFLGLHLELGLFTLWLAHTSFCLPFVALTVHARLQGFDNALVEAARDLGAGEWTAIRRIELPLAAPAIAAGWLMSFTLSLDDAVVSFFVTGPDFEVLPLRIYSMVRLGVKPEVNALASLLFAVSLSFVVLAQWLLLKDRT
ncbi:MULTISPECIES: spermidine/putrescine ABC transporter permease PotC [Methylococcus]|uniref:Spermidine/putrescine transport system permease protein PotC n=1 Tax=Methylococcus capsulatus TaxID=414 RepID=A0ABZ2F2K2_METCP|nr:MULTISPECIES: spermidine/putrescine ABC transporter permease PotC [Methylococcus]MDF9393824.1 spermidine/putrescine ABC transporter permease PotC [Methylococcus capsulatus]